MYVAKYASPVNRYDFEGHFQVPTQIAPTSETAETAVCLEIREAAREATQLRGAELSRKSQGQISSQWSQLFNF